MAGGGAVRCGARGPLQPGSSSGVNSRTMPRRNVRHAFRAVADLRIATGNPSHSPRRRHSRGRDTPPAMPRRLELTPSSLPRLESIRPITRASVRCAQCARPVVTSGSAFGSISPRIVPLFRTIDIDRFQSGHPADRPDPAVLLLLLRGCQAGVRHDGASVGDPRRRFVERPGCQRAQLLAQHRTVIAHRPDTAGPVSVVCQRRHRLRERLGSQRRTLKSGDACAVAYERRPPVADCISGAWVAEKTAGRQIQAQARTTLIPAQPGEALRLILRVGAQIAARLTAADGLRLRSQAAWSWKRAACGTTRADESRSDTAGLAAGHGGAAQFSPRSRPKPTARTAPSARPKRAGRAGGRRLRP